MLVLGRERGPNCIHGIVYFHQPINRNSEGRNRMATPIFTKNGLKIRVDYEAVGPLLALVGASCDLYEELYSEVEVWVDLPQALASFTAICVFALGLPWYTITIFAVLAYSIAYGLSCFFYSKILGYVFSLFLGAWAITLIAAAFFTYINFTTAPAADIVALWVMVLSCTTGLVDFLSGLLAIPRAIIRKLLGWKYGEAEFAFRQVLLNILRKRGFDEAHIAEVRLQVDKALIFHGVDFM